MLISCNRLKKYIKNSEDIDFLTIWDKFTIRVAEIEGVKTVGDTFDGVVVAEIKTCTAHPDSDHMHILTVDCGQGEDVTVVCGAPNVRVGLKTAFVKVGGHIDGTQICQRPLRGIVSNGMCCSEKELGISENHDGIIELSSTLKNGTDINDVIPIKDIIVEIDNKSLTNRPDLWGCYGIAREVCALCNHELLPLDTEEIINDKQDLDIVIKDTKLCNRYTGLTIDNIENKKSCYEDQIFLYHTGMRPINLLVDLTNIIMLEMGQPMHAFDKRVVKKIEVGLANDGDKFTTLDNVERTLSKDMLMIKNDNNYFAIAGVMGGMQSEILSDTDSIFLESANFNAGSVRKTAVNLGLRTEASARYEKSLDPNMTDMAIKRFVYLLKQNVPDIKISSNLTDIYPNKLSTCNIDLRKKLLATYIGKDLPSSQVVEILSNLGFKVQESEEKYEVEVPTFRHSKDINIPEDLIEEIARIYGFENINCEPLKLDLISKSLDQTFDEEYNVKHSLADKFNFTEVHSYLWYNSSTLNELGICKHGVNVLGKAEDNILRDDLCLSLLNIARENFKYLNEFKIMEIGTVINNDENQRHLALIIAGSSKDVSKNYNHAKEIINYLYGKKNLTVKYENHVNQNNERQLIKDLIVEDNFVGTLSILNNSITNKISKNKSVIMVEIDFDDYVLRSQNLPTIKKRSKYPEVELDYTIVLKENDNYESLKKVLDAFQSNLIRSYSLKDIYENKYTIRYILGNDNKTLEQKDLDNFQKRFILHISDNDLQVVQ